jgi:hypothetical protein
MKATLLSRVAMVSTWQVAEESSRAVPCATSARGSRNHEPRTEVACGFETPMPEQLDRVPAGEADPACARCGGIQRSATVASGMRHARDLAGG